MSNKKVQKYNETSKALRRTADEVGANSLPFLLQLGLWGGLFVVVLFLVWLFTTWMHGIKNDLVDIARSIFVALFFLAGGIYMFSVGMTPLKFFNSYARALQTDNPKIKEHFAGFGMFAAYALFGLVIFTNFAEKFTGQKMYSDLSSSAKSDTTFADKRTQETSIRSWFIPSFNNIMLHTVTDGETLEKIAKKHETSVEAILQFNEDLKNADHLKVGQKIKIP